jgi:ribosome maturation factor RimP
MTATTEIDRVRAIVEPIASDLHLDLYDIERRGATLRITLDDLALATRLISREMDHADPVPGRYTLEVTSPGLERHLRTPAHFRREVGKAVTIRLRDVDTADRRVDGVIVAADEATATIRLQSGEERVVAVDSIDRARTVFEWGPKPKPGGKQSERHRDGAGSNRDSMKEKQSS